MKFNIYFTIKGPAGTLEAPNNANPVEAEDIYGVLKVLAEKKLPLISLCELTGIRIREHIA